MPLADDLARHRNLILADLDAVHDYDTRTRFAWRVVQDEIHRGRKITFRSSHTGNLTTDKELPEQAQLYVSEFLAVSTLQQFVSLFDDFLIGFMRHWLLAHHHTMARRQIPLALVFEAADLRDAQVRAIDHELNALSYKRLKDWFIALDAMVKLGCPTDDEIDRLAEIKATRDIFIHNRGVVNPLYVEKAGSKARFTAGEFADVPEQYHKDSWELIKKVVTDTSDAAIRKA